MGGGERAGQDGRTARRLIALLRALNARNGATVLELARATGHSRQSLYRLIDALMDEGLARRTPEGRIHLTAEIRSLAAGFRETDALVDAASPVLEELQREVLWPTDLATYDGGVMRLRETTRRSSPFVLDRVTTGFTLPVLHTGLGLAWLAALGAERRTAALAEIARHDALAANPAAVNRLLAITLREGHGRRHTGFQKGTNTIAVPVLRDGDPLGSIGITYIASALTPEEAARRHLDRLRAAAAAIAARL